jgi:hypothetical protein
VTTQARSLHCFAALGLLSTLSFAPALRAADAPDAPPTPARALFKEGRELAAQGDYKAACPKFEQSLALEAGLGTQFNLADCWEHLGRTASAQALFVGAAASAKAAGESEREQVLRDRAAALEPRIPRLVIEVTDADPKLIVKRGDLPLDGDSFGKAKAVDPGSYEIVAKSPGKKPWKKTVEVPPGAGIVTVEVPPLEPQDAEVAVVPPKPPVPQRPAPAPADSTNQDRPGHGLNLPALGLVGVGVGGLVVGTLMVLKYSSANSDAKNTCPTSRGCTSEQITFHDRRVQDAKGDRSWAYVGFGVGGLGLAAAAALLFLPQSKSETAWVASPVVARDGGVGANLSGRF